MIKLLSITWSYDAIYNYKNTFLYRSFIKHNLDHDFVNIHFNRNNYLEIENKQQLSFDYQYEYILYKIILLKEKIKDIKSDYIIYADSNDVVCLSNIEEILHSLREDTILFSCEYHQYPSPNSIWNEYPLNNKNNNLFLNSGLYVGTKKNIMRMIDEAMDVLSLEYKNFGGDQGVYTYMYINKNLNIKLDINNSIFLSTYLRSNHDFAYQNNRLIDKNNNTFPLFIHDNGWNYGSPKFIEKFHLI